MHEGMHHYHTRKRIHHHFEQWPHPNALKRFIDRMVYVVGFFAIAMTVPQFYEVWINKNAAGVSALSWGAEFFQALFLFFLRHSPQGTPTHDQLRDMGAPEWTHCRWRVDLRLMSDEGCLSYLI